MIEPTCKYIISGPEKEIICHPYGLGYEFYDSMQKHKDKVAQICSQTGVKDSFGDILDRSVKTAIEMKHRGVTSQDTLAICLYVHMNDIIPFIATLFLNCKLASIDPGLSANEIEHIICHIRPKMMFINTETESVMDKIIENINFPLRVISLNSSRKYDNFTIFLKKSDEERDFKPVPAINLKDTALILFTSGTSGKPKGVCLHHYGLICQGASFADDTIKFSKEKVMVISPIYWINTVTTIIACTRAGVCRILLPKYSTKFCWEAIHTHQPSFLLSTPYSIVNLIKDGVPEKIDISSLNIVVIIGSYITENRMMKIRKILPNAVVTMSYGLTKAFGLASTHNIYDPKHQAMIMKKPLMSGWVKANFTYKIVDIETEETINPKETGELRIKTHCSFSGSCNTDWSDSWDKDGWLKTGDLAYIDEDHCIFIVNKITELIRYKTKFRIIPSKLEAVVLGHPDVANAIVVGIPHPLDGEHPCAVVILKRDSVVTEKEIKEYANQRLVESEKLRGGVKIVERFPMASSGKIQRMKLKDLLNSGFVYY